MNSKKNSLEKTYHEINELEQVIQTNLDSRKQLKDLLKKKDENTAHVEKEVQENINTLQDENALLQEKCNDARKQEKTHREQGEQLEKKVRELKNILETMKEPVYTENN